MPKIRSAVSENSFGSRIDAILSHFHLNLKKFAISLGYSPSGLSDVRLGKKGITDKLIHSICATYGINEHWLLTGEGEMKDETGLKSYAEYKKLIAQSLPEYEDPERLKDLIQKLRAIYQEGADTERIMMFGAIENVHDRMLQRKKNKEQEGAEGGT